MTEKCWSNDNERFYKEFDSITYDASIGETYYEGDCEDLKITDIVSWSTVKNFLESLDEAVYEEIGEYSDSDFYNVSKEAVTELTVLVREWANKHVNLPYYKVRNVVEKKFTQEDLD